MHTQHTTKEELDENKENNKGKRESEHKENRRVELSWVALNRVEMSKCHYDNFIIHNNNGTEFQSLNSIESTDNKHLWKTQNVWICMQYSIALTLHQTNCLLCSDSVALLTLPQTTAFLVKYSTGCDVILSHNCLGYFFCAPVFDFNFVFLEENLFE